MAKLALFLDGTWNKPESRTNVSRLRELIAPESFDASPVVQKVYYDQGVGTQWYDRIRGGAFAMGLSANVCEAYDWLVDNYNDEDEIYIFGFSRGAYTARSVAGMIAKCGLLIAGAIMTRLDIFRRYQANKNALPIHEVEYRHRKRQPLSNEDQALLVNSRRVPIKMIGVWDTVGALGIPWTAAPLIGRGNFYFHNTNLSSLYDHSYHALAVDEHRAPYRATLWTHFLPNRPDPNPKSDPPLEKIEQRWFIGAHCNVGGGYENDQLAEIPLAWLQAKAIENGLAFRRTIQLSGKEYLCSPRDSFREFLKGVYRLVRFGKRSVRPIGSGPRSVKGGRSAPINETIDASVFMRYQEVSAYRPNNLEAWAARKGIDISGIRGDCRA